MAPGVKPVVAAVVDPVVVSQALRLDEELEQLQEFNQEDRDPEIEKLLEQLAETLEQLQQPGVDPKEALAKLSEMEAALEAQQQQLASPQMDAQMQQLGEALSLAEPLATAGMALEQGEFEKAAEEMERQDLPELDRQTERAVVEKLDQLKQAAADGAAAIVAGGARPGQRRTQRRQSPAVSGWHEGPRRSDPQARPPQKTGQPAAATMPVAVGMQRGVRIRLHEPHADCE